MPHLMVIERKEPETWHLFSKLPNSVQHKLFTLPIDDKEAWGFIHRMEKDANLSGSTFLENVARAWTRRNSDESAKSWMERHLREHREKLARVSSLGHALYLHIKELTWQESALSLWRSTTGAVPLSIETHGKKTFIRVGKVKYPAIKKSDSWTLQVPRDQVARPAWNPIDTDKMTAIIQAGVPSPKVYPTMLGHDGRFYLLDGNHRFRIDRRSIISVSISDPPTTGSLSQFLDVVNVPQPAQEKVLQYEAGTISWRQLVGEEAAERFFHLEPSKP